MTNYEKMIELVGEADKKTIKDWAYMNRVVVCCLHFENHFESMEKSVDQFMESKDYSSDEFKNWDKFLDAEFIAKE